MAKTQLHWTPATTLPPVSERAWLFIAYRYDGLTYIALGYYGKSIESWKPASYCIWPCSALLPDTEVVAWLDAEAVLKVRASKCRISPDDRLPPWSNRSVQAMFRYTSRFRMYPFLVYLNGADAWDFAYWGAKERKQDRLGSVGKRGSRFPTYRPRFSEARAPYERVYEDGEVRYWMDPVRMVLTSPTLMKALPGPVVTVDLGLVPYSRDIADLRYRKKEMMKDRRAAQLEATA